MANKTLYFEYPRITIVVLQCMSSHRITSVHWHVRTGLIAAKKSHRNWLRKTDKAFAEIAGGREPADAAKELFRRLNAGDKVALPLKPPSKKRGRKKR